MRTGKTVLNDLDCLTSAPSFAFAKLFLRELPRMYFTAVLLMQNCKRTENEIKSVRPKFARSPLTVNRIESPEPNPSRQPSVAMYRRKTVQSAKGICDD